VRGPAPGGAAGPPGLAHRVQRDDQEAPGRDDRPAHGRRRPALPPPRERDRPEPVLQRHDLRPPLVPHRAPAGRRDDDEQEQGQLLHAWATWSRRATSPMAVRYALLSGHPRKQLNFTLDSLHAAESALGTLRRVPRTLGRPRPRRRSSRRRPAPSTRSTRRFATTSTLPGGPGGALHGDQRLCPRGRNRGPTGRPSTPSSTPSASTSRRRRPRRRLPPGGRALAERRGRRRRPGTSPKPPTGCAAELAAAGWSMLDGKDGFELEPAKKA
jgi:hypothetical protein